MIELSAKDEQIASLSRQIEQLNLSLSENHKETQRIVSELSMTIKKLSKQLYGSRSEKLTKLSVKKKRIVFRNLLLNLLLINSNRMPLSHSRHRQLRRQNRQSHKEEYTKG